MVEDLEKEGIETHRTSLSLSLLEKGLSTETAESNDKKRGVVGTKAEDGNKADLAGSIAPYLVVTPQLSDDGKEGPNRTELYALILEEPALNGLCLPTIVSQSKKLLVIMKQSKERLKHMPSTALMAFLDNENEDFGEEDAEAMNKEIAELWPGFEKKSVLAFCLH
ncbi:hypothetical protein EAF00_001028 [Botryotinia globosa]|nr:hypothetical protein EAF00_001028 [Botryotinia globosa]